MHHNTHTTVPPVPGNLIQHDQERMLILSWHDIKPLSLRYLPVCYFPSLGTSKTIVMGVFVIVYCLSDCHDNPVLLAILKLTKEER